MKSPAPTKKILYVENDPSWARLLRATLPTHLRTLFPNEVFEVVTLANHAELEQALAGNKVRPTSIYGHDAAREVNPDLIITDNMAPAQDKVSGSKTKQVAAGYEWISQRSPEKRNIPCIMFSDGALDALVPALAAHGVPLVPKHHGPGYDAPKELAFQIGASLGLSPASAPPTHTDRVAASPRDSQRGK